MSTETLAQTEALILTETAAPEPLTFRQVLRFATLRRLWYAQIVSVFGDFLALFAVITYMTFKLHATAQQITGVQIAYLLPLAILGVISGVFVDRWPVKVTLVSSDYIRAALVLLLLIVHSILGFYLVLAAISVVSSFFGPAQGISIRAAVPYEGLRAANGLMQQVYFVMRIVGPSTAALMVHHFGARACFVMDTASFLASGTLIASLTLILPASKRDAHPVQAELSGIARILADMREATGFILHHAALLFVIVALCACMFVLGCAGPLIAIYVRDILHATGSTFAFTFAMIGFGLIVGVNGLNTFGKHLKNTTQVYYGLCGIALGTLILATLPFVATTVAGCFVIGCSAAGILVPSALLMQQETPVEMLGRVNSTAGSASFTTQVAGLVLCGVLTEHTSIRIVFGISTGLLAAIILVGKVWIEPKEPLPTI
jgi:MFS family permease